jgi:hypothetical protein
MYPDNHDIEIFGEHVSWPGVAPNGKFTNGSFNDPMVKPSFIPAETINLILDNLESVIRKYGGTPNATSPTQLADVLHGAIVMQDEHCKAMKELEALRQAFNLHLENSKEKTFFITFLDLDDLDGIELVSANWNEPLAKLEC